MAADVKLFEVRDDGTTMPVIAIKPNAGHDAERWLWAKGGYGIEMEDQRPYVLLGPLHGGEGMLVCDPFKHPGAPHTRTLPVAHQYIIEHWDYLVSGDVVDVQFIKRETTEAKLSEREAE